MTVGFVVNNIETEKAVYTTVFLSQRLHNAGHTVYLMGVGDLAYYPDGYMGATAVCADRNHKFKSPATYIDHIHSDKAERVRVTAPDLDVLILRNDPSSEPVERAWAQNAGIIFGQLAMRHGVIVLNDPTKLSDATNKMLEVHFIRSIR